jgi:hypothetical protein
VNGVNLENVVTNEVVQAFLRGENNTYLYVKGEVSAARGYSFGGRFRNVLNVKR